MNKQNIEQAYAIAKERYAELGSRHRRGSGQTTEDIALAALLAGRRRNGLRESRRTTFGRHTGHGQLPGKARNIEELRQDASSPPRRR